MSSSLYVSYKLFSCNKSKRSIVAKFPSKEIFTHSVHMSRNLLVMACRRVASKSESRALQQAQRLMATTPLGLVFGGLQRPSRGLPGAF